jgi:hypothetical protein
MDDKLGKALNEVRVVAGGVAKLPDTIPWSKVERDRMMAEITAEVARRQAALGRDRQAGVATMHSIEVIGSHAIDEAVIKGDPLALRCTLVMHAALLIAWAARLDGAEALTVPEVLR